MKQFAPNCSTILCGAAQFQALHCFLAIYSKKSYKASIFKPISFLDMRVLGTVWGRAKGAALAAPLALGLTTAACAQDAAPLADSAIQTSSSEIANDAGTELLAETTGTDCGVIELEGYTDAHAASCATPGYEAPRTLEEILADESLAEAVVLHFGPGFLDANLAAYDLTQDADTPAVAIPGGDVNTVQLVIAGRTTGRLKFDQHQLNGGEVGSFAQWAYARRMAEITAAADTGEAQVIQTASVEPTGLN